MNKRGIIKVGVVGLLLGIIILLVFLIPSLSSGDSVSNKYALGQAVKFDLPSEEVKVKIVGPEETKIIRSKGALKFKPKVLGDYRVIFLDRVHRFRVVGDLEREVREVVKDNFIEREITPLKKEIEVMTFNETNETNESIVVESEIDEELEVLEEERIKVVDSEGDEVEFEALDNDLDGVIDNVEFEAEEGESYIIIVIIGAEHLYSNRTVIENVYSEVGELDDTWKEIPDGHYVRVVFEENLTSENDITIFARVVSGDPRVEIYEEDSDFLIGEFYPIKESEYDKFLLEDFSGNQDTFDLRVVGGIVSFDHIIDPSSPSYGGDDTSTRYGYQENLVRTDDGSLFIAYLDGDFDFWCANSSDGGKTWTNVEVYDAITGVDPTIVTNGTRVVLVVEDGASEHDIMTAYTDSGCSDVSAFSDVPGMSSIGGAGVMDQPVAIYGGDGLFHLFAIEANDDIKYTNSSDGVNWNTAIEPDSNDNDYVDAEVDSNGNIWLASTEINNGQEKFQIMNSSDYFQTKTDAFLVTTNNVDPYPSITVGNNDEVYAAFGNITQGVFYFINSSDGINFDMQGVATENYGVGSYEVHRDPVVKVHNDTGEIYVFFGQDINSDEHHVFYANSTDGGESWSSQLLHYNLYNPGNSDDFYPSPRGGRYPLSNRITNETGVDYVYASRWINTGTNQYQIVYRVLEDVLNPFDENATGVFVSSSNWWASNNQQATMTYLDDSGRFGEKEWPTGTAGGSPRSWQTIECMEKREDCVLMWSDTLNDIHMEILDTTTGTWSDYMELDPDPQNDNTPMFDLACEDLSGECLLIYNIANRNQNLGYRVYYPNGTLSAESTIDFFNQNARKDWVKLYPKQGSNDIVVAVQDEYFDLDVNVWNGTSNSFVGGSAATEITDSLPNVGDRKAFDFAWEGESGEGLMVYSLVGVSGMSAYLFNHTDYTWSSLGAINTSVMSGTGPNNIALCGSDAVVGGKSNDYIGIILQDWDGAQAYLYAFMWNGSEILSGEPSVDSLTEELTATENVDCAWEKSGNQAVFVWNDLNSFTPSWASYTIGSGWDISALDSGNQTGFRSLSNVVDDVELIADHKSDEILLFAMDLTENTYCFNWDGDVFDDYCLPLAIESASHASTFKSKTFDYYRYDDIAPQVNITSPQAIAYATGVISFNITLNEAGSCNYSLDSGATNETMTADSNNLNFGDINSSVPTGSYTMNAYCSDIVGNANNSVNVSFSVDSEFPLVDYGGGMESNDTNHSRDWIFVNVTVVEDNEENITFGLYNDLGGVNVTTLTTPVRQMNFTGIADGLYYYNVSVCDSLSQCNSTPTNWIRLDDTAPVINIIAPEAITYSQNESLPLNVTVSDNLVGLSVCWYTLNGGADQYVSCNVNTTFNASSDGPYTLVYYSNDTLGNEKNESVSFFVSVNAPAVSLEYPTDGGGVNFTTSIQLNYSGTDDDGLDACRLWGNWSGGWHLNQTDYGPATGTTNTFYVNLSQGIYFWNVWCNDSVGSSAFSPVNYTFYVDTVYPNISFAAPTNQSGTSVSRNWIYVNLSIGENFGGNINYTLYDSSEILENTTDCSCGPGNLTVNWTDLSQGLYFYNVTYTDKGGNINFTETRNITLDTENPNGTLLSPDDSSYQNNTQQNFTVNGTDNLGLGNFTLFIFDDVGALVYNASEIVVGATQIVVGLVYTFLTDGIFNWFYRITDLAGNTFETGNRTVTIDTDDPTVDFNGGVEGNDTSFERDWIYVNVTHNDTNFANITFGLYNDSGGVNVTTYTTLINETNWTPLQDHNTTYYYNVSVYDLAGNLNVTPTNWINLIDVTNPALTLTRPINRTYYSRSLRLSFTATDVNLDSCWYTIDSGVTNTSVENCASTYVDVDSDGVYTLVFYVNDSLGNMNSSNISFTVSTLGLRNGILAYAEGTTGIPNYRLWNGYEFGDEAEANQVVAGGQSIEYVRAKKNPRREEYIILTSDSQNDINVQINSSILGTPCWHNGTTCNEVYELDDNVPDITRPRADFSYETLSGDALIVWSNNTAAVEYITWNGSSWSSPQVISQTNVPGIIDYIKVVSHPQTDEIAMIISDETYLTVMIWNGTAWGCEPGGAFSISMQANRRYQQADVVYEQTSGDLFVIAVHQGNQMNYVTKANGTCSFNEFSDTTDYLEAEMVSLGEQPGSDYVLISYWDRDANDMKSNVWNGTDLLTASTTEADVLAESGNNHFISAAWAGEHDRGIIVYSDAETDGYVDYFYYNKTADSWDDNSGAGYDATDLVEMTTVMRNVWGYTFLGINRSLFIIKDNAGDLWAKGYDPDLDEWINYDKRTALNLDVIPVNWPNFDFSFNYDIVGPQITVNFPNSSLVGSTNVTFNITTTEKSTCNIYVNGDSGNSMTSSDSINFLYNNDSMSEGDYNVTFECFDPSLNTETEDINFSLDANFPLVDYGGGMESNDTNHSRDWIFVNVTVVESYEVNITFGLYDESTSVNVTTLTTPVRQMNFTSLSDGVYYYNVSVCDSNYGCNSTETRLIRIDDTAPSIIMDAPESKTYKINSSLPLNVTVNDNLVGLSVCWYSLDGGANEYVSCNVNTTFDVDAGDGPHTFNYFVNDTLGNQDNLSVGFFVSVFAPAITLEFPDEENYFNKTGDLVFNYTPSDNQDVDVCEFWGNWSGGWHLNQTDYDPENTLVNQFNLTYLAEGIYFWNVWCNDTTGSFSFAPENVTFGVDITYPEIAFVAPTNGTGDLANRSWIYVNVSVNESNEDFINFTLYDSSEILINATSSTTNLRTINWTGLTSGAYYYNVTLVDLADNTNFTETRNITLDITNPNGTLLSPDDSSYQNNTQQNFTVNATDNYGLENVTLFIFDDVGALVYNGSQAVVGATQIVVGIIYTFLTDGIFNWFYRVTDLAGNFYDVSNNSVIIDSVYPTVDFNGGVEGNDTSFERDWIYVNVTHNDTNFANITFGLYNDSGGVNVTTYTTLINETNWTPLEDHNTTYYYNVSVYDLAGNLNVTPTNWINLIDVTNPALTLTRPVNRTYYNRNIYLNFTVNDSNLGECWYNLNGGDNNSVSSCAAAYIDVPSDGFFTLSFYVNDSVGNLNSSNVSFTVNTSGLRSGILAYADGPADLVRYRLWNGYEFGSELTANQVGTANIESIRIKRSPVRNEYFLVTTDADNDVNIQVNSSLSGTPCWHNGTACGGVYEPETGLPNFDRMRGDFSYETLSGDGLVAWSNGDNTIDYVTWNGTHFSSVQNVGQTHVSGTIAYVKLASHPYTNEIAMIFTNEVALNILIWNGTAWGCEPASSLGVNMEAGQRYQQSDVVYEQVSGDLFVSSVYQGSQISYVTKPNASCTYTEFSDTAYDLEAELIASSPQYGSDYVLTAYYDIGNSEQVKGSTWNGTNLIDGSNTDTNVNVENSPNQIIGVSWAGESDMGVLVYSDSDTTSRYIDYFLYNKSSGWDDNSGTGYIADSLPEMSFSTRNYWAYSFLGINRSLILVQDEFSDLWAKGYDGDLNEWINYDKGVALGGDVSPFDFPNFDFSFNYDVAGPYMVLNSPWTYYNYSNVTFNVTSYEFAQSCNYSIDSGPSVYMVTSDNFTFFAYNSSLNEDQSYTLNVTCTDIYGNARRVDSNFTLDYTYPNISFVNDTEEDGVTRERFWIYANVSVDENNEANITFRLYNTSGEVNVTNFTTAVREINWTVSFSGDYYYNVSVSDDSGNVNTTEMRTITLEFSTPVINLTYPSENSNFSTHTIEFFNFTVSDLSDIINCSLYGNWSGGWHLNQTISNPTKDSVLNFSSVDTGASGNFLWNVRCYDYYENDTFNSTNFTFGAYLPPDSVSFTQINQTEDDGTGDVNIYWGASGEAVAYRIYSSTNLTDWSFVTQTEDLNYTDSTFSGNRRKFYRVDSWNPGSSNSSYVGAHVYSLRHSGNTVNWIAFPSNFSYIVNASDGLNKITNATAFTMFNETTQSNLTCNDFSCPDFPSCTATNCNFLIEGGRGYQVNINNTAPSEINWSGVGKVHDNLNVSLYKNATSFGKNWISIISNTSLSNAQDLLNNITNSDAVSRWNSATQTSEGYVYIDIWGIYVGTNFDLEMEEGYEVSVNQTTWWSQG